MLCREVFLLSQSVTCVVQKVKKSGEAKSEKFMSQGSRKKRVNKKAQRRKTQSKLFLSICYCKNTLFHRKRAPARAP